MKHPEVGFPAAYLEFSGKAGLCLHLCMYHQWEMLVFGVGLGCENVSVHQYSVQSCHVLCVGLNNSVVDETGAKVSYN